MVIKIPELYDCVQPPTWVSEHKILVFILSVGAAFALVFIIYQAYTQYILSRKPYWQRALDDLDLLSLPVSSLLADKKRFYDGLTRILKWYCGNRYGWFLKSKTDEELVAVLRAMDVLDNELLGVLEASMRVSTQVKFTKDLVSPEQAEADKRSVVSFIERSIPVRT